MKRYLLYLAFLSFSGFPMFSTGFDFLLAFIFGVWAVCLWMLFFRFRGSREHVGSIGLFIYLHISLIWGPILSNTVLNKNIGDELSRAIVMLGLSCEVLLMFGYMLMNKYGQKHGNIQEALNLKGLSFVRVSPSLLLSLFFLTIYALSFLSFALGVSPMGVPAPELPYKLEPLLNIARSIVIPVLFVFLWEKIQRTHWRYLLIAIALFFIWTVFEIYAKGSRGFFLAAFMPLGLYLLAYSRLSLKKTMALFVLAFMFAILNFSVGQMRRGNITSDHQSVTRDYNPLSHFSESTAFLLYRIFPDAWLFKKFKPFIPQGNKISNIDLYEKYRGGGVGFHTYKLDKTPANEAHSSGISGLSDGFLLFGWPGAYLTGLLFILYFLVVDFRVISRSFSIMLIYYGIGLLFFQDGFWSFIFFRSPLTVLALPLSSLLFALFLKGFEIQYEERERRGTVRRLSS